MNIANNRGGQPAAEPEPLQRPYFKKDGCFAGSLRDAHRVTPTTAHLINVIKDCIRMNEESGDFNRPLSTWINRCYHEIVWRLEETEQKV